MVAKTGKIRTKRLPKGQRTHVRRLKQAARKESGITNPYSSPAQPAPAPKKQEQAKVVD